jgi:uncharacterized protein YceH (UPF0502 family)
MSDPHPSPATIRPLDAAERRVLGTLVEKAKTTPDQYPLSLNALVNGCNQKSNRDPAMTLDEEQVMKAITSLRALGAAAEVFGNGSLARYRHHAYEWLGVGKEELAILGELLLRGAQTEGDLRGRASRMDPIPDLDALRQHLDALAARRLVVWLSPPGRGRMLTHGLLPPEKLDKVRRELGIGTPAATGAGVGTDPAHEPADEPVVAETARIPSAPDPVAAGLRPAPEPATAAVSDRIATLEATVADLQARLAALEAALS